MIINILTATGTQSIWKAERTIFYGKSSQEFGHPFNVWTDLHGSNAEPLATYTPNGENEAYVDMTDYIRAYPNVGHVYFYNQTYFEAVIDIQVTVAGIINPAGVYIPPFNMPDALVVPPERILYAGLSDIKCELYPTDLRGTWELTNGLWVDSTTKRQILAINEFSITRKRQIMPLATRVSKFYYIGNTGASTSCDNPAVAVRWVSFTGVERIHHFLLRKPTIAADNNYQLLTLDNSYDEIKGRVDSLELYIDELIPYDLWYYADIITSSKVEVSLDGTNWYQVQVTNKNVTIPTGEMGNGKLEITVNWRRYDAVTM